MNGKTLGHYRVGKQLGRGGMDEVYAADDLNLNRKVAMRFLPDAFAGDPERMARFEREAKLLASLNHPNIAAIYGLEQAEAKTLHRDGACQEIRRPRAICFLMQVL